jgi:hypothetical protein
MNTEDIALTIFCALMSRPNAEIDLYPELGEKQIRVCFALAETFVRVAKERRPPMNLPKTGGKS